MENEWHRCLLLYFRRSWEKGMWLGSSLKMQWSKRKVSWGMPCPKPHGSRLLWEKNVGLIRAHRQVPHLCGWISLSNSTFLQKILQVLWNKASYRWIMIFPNSGNFSKNWIFEHIGQWLFAIMLCSLMNKNVAYFFCSGKAVCALSSIKLCNLKVVHDLQEL